MFLKKIIQCVLIVTFVFSILLPGGYSIASGQTNNPEMKIVGQIGGPTRTVAVQGHFAYVGTGLCMKILDVSNPAGLLEMGSTGPLDWYAEDIFVSGNTAYIAAGGAGLYTTDISDPLQPKILGRYDTMGYAEGVAVKGGYAFVADGPDGIRIIDVSKPSSMKEVASAYTMDYAFDVAIQGDYAYIAAAGAGMLALKVSNPAKPAAAGSLDTQGYAYGIAVSGNTAFVADGWEGLQTVDVSNPARLKEIGLYDTYGWANDVVSDGAKVYAAAANGGVRIFDASVKGKLTDMGYFAMPDSHFQQLAIQGNTVYVADTRQGVHIIDTSDPAKPVRTGLYSPMGWAQAVEVSGNHAYVAAQNYGFRVFDITDKTHPREVNALMTGDPFVTVALKGNTAYVGTFFGLTNKSAPKLYSINIKDPLHFIETSSADLAARPTYSTLLDGQMSKDGIYMVSRNLMVNDGILYNSGEWGLYLMDTAQPMNPSEISFIQVTDGPTGENPTAISVAVSGGMAYLVVSGGGLYVVNVSDPKHPSLVCKYSEPISEGSGKKARVIPSRTNDIVISGIYAYVMDNNFIRVLDISDPAHPKSVSLLTLPQTPINNCGRSAHSLVIDGRTLYIADSAAGILTADITDPRKPRITQQLALPGHASWLSLDKNYIYAAAEDGGLYIVGRTATGITAAESLSGKTAAGKSPAAKLLSQLPGTSCGSKYQPVPLISRRLAGTTGSIPALAGGSTLTVISTADSGPGTLRQCLESARIGDTVLFDTTVFPPRNPAVIFLKSGLFINKGGITIDGSNAGVILDGGNVGGLDAGLNINSDNNKVKGLQIVHFPGCGIEVTGSGNIIGGDRQKGTKPLGEGNLVSGNRDLGLHLCNENATGNRIIGNFIGTDASGAKSYGKQSTGISIDSNNNYIGGPASSDGNVISGNWSMNIEVKSASGNLISGNYLGTDAAGKKKIDRPANFCMILEVSSSNNRVQGNVVSGGIFVCDSGSSYNEITGNCIGTDKSGSIDFGDNSFININQPFNRVGGIRPVDRNIVNGMVYIGMTSNNIVINNFIGIKADGRTTFGSDRGIISIYDGSCHNFVGGPTSAERNVVYNGNVGCISISGMSRYNFILGNFIGSDAFGKRLSGFMRLMISASDGNTVQGNLVTGGSEAGISIYQKSNGNVITFNNIIGNGKFGLSISDASGNTVAGNNFSNNKINASDTGGSNFWDLARRGNYWSDYKWKDSNKDGVGDIPYKVLDKGLDRFPLIMLVRN